jgi:hypothetical protein
MADFCAQCSIDNFGDDFRDMAGISTESDTRVCRFAVVLCEDCGPCQVDHNGQCVSVDCLKRHGADNGTALHP